MEKVSRNTEFKKNKFYEFNEAEQLEAVSAGTLIADRADEEQYFIVPGI